MNKGLIAGLLVPYLVIQFLSGIATASYSSDPTEGDDIFNIILDANTAESDEATSDGGIIQGGFTLVTDTTGNLFSWTGQFFKVITLNYPWWSQCGKSTYDNKGFSGGSIYQPGTPRTEATGECYEFSDGSFSQDAPMGFMIIRWFIILLAIPGLYVVMYKMGELFARFLSGVGGALSSLKGMFGGGF
tara:strand:+ start:10240 stop:10803 length:564 start_codon:yes stop_codon:yes gene_type:complete